MTYRNRRSRFRTFNESRGFMDRRPYERLSGYRVEARGRSEYWRDVFHAAKTWLRNQATYSDEYDPRNFKDMVSLYKFYYEYFDLEGTGLEMTLEEVWDDYLVDTLRYTKFTSDKILKAAGRLR